MCVRAHTRRTNNIGEGEKGNMSDVNRKIRGQEKNTLESFLESIHVHKLNGLN